jgi:hypothetical protein
LLDGLNERQRLFVSIFTEIESGVILSAQSIDVTVKGVEHELQTVSGQLATICIDRIRKLNAGRC